MCSMCSIYKFLHCADKHKNMLVRCAIVHDQLHFTNMNFIRDRWRPEERVDDKVGTPADRNGQGNQHPLVEATTGALDTRGHPEQA
jgi:hypothetical protein